MKTETLGAVVLICLAVAIATTAILGSLLVFWATSGGAGFAITVLTLFGIGAEMSIFKHLSEMKPDIRPPVQVPDGWPPGKSGGP